MTERTPVELEAIRLFLASGFDGGFEPVKVIDQEQLVVSSIVERVDTLFNHLTYVLGLTLDFTMLSQKLSQFDPEAKHFREALSEEMLWKRYERVTKRGKKQLNTLSVTFEKKPFGIRAIEEAVCDLFVKADRTGYPNAYVYNSGMWHHYKDLLLSCFKLSESGRFILCNKLIDFGLEKFPKNTYFGRETPRVRLFEAIVSQYPRAGGNENAGMAYQGIAYGYLNADRPHLSLIVDKVRTGSARQRRFGDIDGYFGLDLEISVEVKDDSISLRNVKTELGQFLLDVSNHRVQGLAFVRSIDPESREMLKAKGKTGKGSEDGKGVRSHWPAPHFLRRERGQEPLACSPFSVPVEDGKGVRSHWRRERGQEPLACSPFSVPVIMVIRGSSVPRRRKGGRATVPNRRGDIPSEAARESSQ